MKVSVRIDTSGLQRKISRVQGLIAEEAEGALRQLASEAIDLIEGSADGERRRYVAKALERQFNWVFIPVILKHVRREMWPDLMAIYRARIVRGNRTYQGRKRFHVDHLKEEALFEKLLARALARHTRSSYEVRFVQTSDRKWRVEIVKTGGGKVDDRDRSVMIAFAKQRITYLAEETMRRAFSRAGLIEGYSPGGRAWEERERLAEQIAASGEA